MKEPAETVFLNLKVGRIPVTSDPREKDILWMIQKEPTFGRTLEPEDISGVLGLSESEIDNRFAIQEVSTGLFFIIVPLMGLDALKQAKVNKDECLKLIENTQAKMILVFCPETYNRGNDLNVRVFCDYYGIAEDPATGSGNGCLAAYLVKHRYFVKDQIDIRVEQGYEIGRPSLLFLRAENKQGKIDVSVGGKVVMVAKGRLL